MYRYERRYTLGYFSLNSTRIQNTYDCFMYAFYVISVWDALIQLSIIRVLIVVRKEFPDP